MVKKGKAWWLSKTMWINVLAIVALIAQGQFGFVLDATTQVTILAVINMGLRVVTKEAVEWK